ncbi:hypothetical protein AMAG_12434 [Allomyces macrogynus ATCC 38327]|uniref:Uncharacterized protein n=1 Tax=Allomyces macrogynus (strain ATCC 38327) TaxID=578462 RepID=A0A0L0SZ61_ALLM3|nr:hypothetical protein AMAG_12434 [Allomyces macrogynus ATCC 38327]|eukprot:KNE67700.1 hypothetical protein AMAG_12434 [Allomyces macrogynus ATCC 38327]
MNLFLQSALPKSSTFMMLATMSVTQMLVCLLAVLVMLFALILPVQPASMAVASKFKITTSQATWGSACAVVGSRLFMFGGSLGDTGSLTDTTTTCGIYSIDINRTITTGAASDLQMHGLLDSEDPDYGFRNQIAFVRLNGQVFLIGGRYNNSVGEALKGDFTVEVAYLFDATTGESKRPDSKAGIPYHSSIQASAAIYDKSAPFIYMFGGYKDKNLTVENTLTVIQGSDGRVISSNLDTSEMDGRGLASLGRFNASHQVISGGTLNGRKEGDVLDDQWLFSYQPFLFTRLPHSMANARYLHQSVGYKNRYLIHVGGASPAKQYELVEYVDLKSSQVKIGTIDNPSMGPKSLASGCMHMEGDVIIYMGGFEPTENDVLAAFVNLLLVQANDSDGTLKFRWVTGTGVPTAATPSNGTVAKMTPTPEPEPSNAVAVGERAGL